MSRLVKGNLFFCRNRYFVDGFVRLKDVPKHRPYDMLAFDFRFVFVSRIDSSLIENALQCGARITVHQPRYALGSNIVCNLFPFQIMTHDLHRFSAVGRANLENAIESAGTAQ